MKKYDFMIVGAGLTGCTLAYELTRRGKSCMVVDKKSHIGGNCFDEDMAGINVHKYGPHIFHTNDLGIWEFIKQFAVFNDFINSPLANYKGEIYNLPINMNTFNKLWGVITPREARLEMEKQFDCREIKSFEDKAMSLVGRDVYEKIIKGYSRKQWLCDLDKLPECLLNRLPVRYTYDNNYFNDKFQGIPINGYTQIFNKMLQDVPVILNTDFLLNRVTFGNLANKVIYTGRIDEYYDYCFGELEYIGRKFETETINTNNHQGVAVINYTDTEIPWLRTVEHKHFTRDKSIYATDFTIVTKEYSVECKTGDDAYYPVHTFDNEQKYQQYEKLAATTNRVFFAGRLGKYKYCDMDDAILDALEIVNILL